MINKYLYLISAERLEIAKSIAREMNLKSNQWRYIPFDDKYRFKKLAGHRTKKENLIGYFSKEEINYLTAWTIGLDLAKCKDITVIDGRAVSD